jgi:hypothetical protein
MHVAGTWLSKPVHFWADQDSITTGLGSLFNEFYKRTNVERARPRKQVALKLTTSVLRPVQKQAFTAKLRNDFDSLCSHSFQSLPNNGVSQDLFSKSIAKPIHNTSLLVK